MENSTNIGKLDISRERIFISLYVKCSRRNREMLLSDIIKQACNNLKSRKSATVINIGLLFFSLLVIIASEMFSAFYNSGIGQIFDGVEGRTLDISYFDYADDKNMTIDKLYDEINTYFKDDKRVEIVGIGYYSGGDIEAEQLDKEFQNHKDIGMGFRIYNSAYEKYLLKGNGEGLNSGEIYIPKYLNVDNEYIGDGRKKINYKDGDKYIGKKVKVKFSCKEYITGETVSEFEKEFTIVGTYDNFALGDFSFIALGNFNDVKELYQKTGVFDTDIDEYKEFMEKFYAETGGSSYDINNEYIEEWKNFMARAKIEVIVKKYKDMDAVEQEIRERLGQSADRRYYEPENKEIIDSIVNAVRIAGYVLIVISAINITCSMIKSIVKRRKEFALLCAVGYKNKNIYSIIFAEMVIIAGIALIAAFVIYGIALVVVNAYVAGNLNEMYSRLSAVIPMYIWLTRLGLVFLGILIAQLFSVKKIKSIVPARELKEE